MGGTSAVRDDDAELEAGRDVCPVFGGERGPMSDERERERLARIAAVPLAIPLEGRGSYPHRVCLNYRNTCTCPCPACVRARQPGSRPSEEQTS